MTTAHTNGIRYLAVMHDQDLENALRDCGSQNQLREWIHFGAVYVDGRRQRQNVPLKIGQTIRLHTRPKRYNWSPRDLSDRLVVNNSDFLILDKPAGLPTHPTLDNYWENAKLQLKLQLGYAIFTTHRLDIPTEGLLMFAKTSKAQSEVNRLFQNGRVEKIYRAITKGPVPLGLHTHFMDTESRPPKKLRLESFENAAECRLEVLACRQREDGNFVIEMRLHTGKTHQIRSQLSFMNAPILGDTLYGSENTMAHERIALECYSLSFAFRSKTWNVSRKNSLAAPHFG